MSTTINEPKRFAQFEKYRQELFGGPVKYQTDHPFSFAIERSNHEIHNLEELIKVAEGVEGRTVKSRIAGWKRQLARRIAGRNRILLLVAETLNETKRPMVSKNRF